ncbi:uncharacterized protein [Venturia canescens]|uniref:uncharacterized protein isoform X2 n=1 Tax=Venturia canescens TaxID=32260 RepID=UPI001C9D0BBF|nr:uncharacterized protein LOC122410055 isoform X2 [Venturia canescens]
MADTSVLRSTLRLLLLLTVAVLAAVGSNTKQASLEASAQTFLATPRSANNTLNVTGLGAREREHLSPKVHELESVKAKDVSWDEYNGEEDEQGDGEDEPEDEETDESDAEVDEYEDELREIAESHEAMAKDQRRNGISNATHPTSLVSKNQSFAPTSSDPRKNTDGFMFYESSLSKGSVADDDEEVAELLSYKQKAASVLLGEKLVSGNSELGTKVKRVPTVKKELSSQKEILNGNETQLSLPKTLASDIDILNRLDDDTKTETRYELPIFSRDADRYEPLVRDDTSFDEEYSEFEAPGDLLRKLDKRQPFERNALRSFLRHANNSERLRVLQELGIEEEAVVDMLMELHSRLSEKPHPEEPEPRILADIRGASWEREYPADSQKRGHSSDSLLQIPTTMDTSEPSETPSTTKKPKKKKKKKKKKLRQGLTNVTSTNKPVTTTTTVTPSPVPPFLPTTASNWPATTQAQWRLVAERLFAAPWSEKHNETPLSTSQIRLVKEGLSSINDKQRVSLKTLNDERQALMLQSAREYSQPRRLHYGKVNTHEKGSPDSDQDNTVKSYNSERNAPIVDYNLDESRPYEQRPISMDPYERYGHYARQRIRYYNFNPVEREQENDYDEAFEAPEDVGNHRPFARTQPFRPLGREYASTKTWQDSRYDYTRPWKDKARTTGFDTIVGSGGNYWPWRNSQRDYKIWSPHYQQAWPRDRNYWQRVGNVEDQLEEIMSDDDNENDVPPVNQQRQQQRNWHMRHEDSSRWPLDRNVDIPSWQIHDRPKSHARGNFPIGSLEKSKNLSELNNKEVMMKPVVKDNPAMPKITMKTWNSLTSDPATWPFKLNGAKPWPKDKNGNSYNPNAELVRKLGLDKQDRLLSSAKDISGINKEILPEDSGKNKIIESTESEGDNRNELDTRVNPIKNPISWPEKLGGIDEWKSRPENERLPQTDQTGQMWSEQLADGRKLWPGQSPISPKISSVGAWVMPADQSTWRPYDLKHKVYGQVSDEQRWNGPTNSEETDRRTWSSNNKVESGRWPQKTDDWNVIGSVYGADKSASAGHSSTWPSKWRQFAYHKVTAAPVTKSGSLSVLEGSNRPRNSYIAVSAVSPPKYPNNEWRKNDIEETQLDRNSGANRDTSIDQDDPTSQLRKSSPVTNERWKEKTRIGHVKENDLDRTRNDPLEHQLEELRHRPYWNHEQLHGQTQLQKRSDVSGNSSITFVTTETSRVPVESSSVDNEILKNRAASMTIPESQTHGKKNVTQ